MNGEPRDKLAGKIGEKIYFGGFEGCSINVHGHFSKDEESLLVS